MTLLLSSQRIEELQFAAKLLDQGQPVALPTETVYGLAADGLNQEALARIFSMKARPHFDPLILHVLDFAGLQNLVKAIHPLHKKLADFFWPGPLTMLFEKSDVVPDLCTAGMEWVAIRSPRHPVFRRILEIRQGRPLAAPSANRFTSISPTCPQDVLEELGPHGLQAVVDGGICDLGIESTVVKVLSDSEIVILRLGSLSIEELKTFLGDEVTVSSSLNNSQKQAHSAPGQSERHYSPRKTLRVFADARALQNEIALLPLSYLQNIALIEVFADLALLEVRKNFSFHQTLSQHQSWNEAARNLFSTLREMDKNSAQQIWAVLGAETSLGAAINDRLKRASKKS